MALERFKSQDILRVACALGRIINGDIPARRDGLCYNVELMVPFQTQSGLILREMFRCFGLQLIYPVDVRWSDVYGTEHEETWCRLNTQYMRNAAMYYRLPMWEGAYGERRLALAKQCLTTLLDEAERRANVLVAHG